MMALYSSWSLHWEHPVVPRTTTLAAKPTVNWLLCCAFMGLALPRYWGKYRPSNKQFMTWSNFDLGPPEMPLPSENEKNQTCGDIKQWLAVCVKCELGQDKPRVTSFDLTGYFRIHAFILIFYPRNRLFSASVLVLFSLLVQSPDQVLLNGFRGQPGGDSLFTAGVCLALPCLAFLHQHVTLVSQTAKLLFMASVVYVVNSLRFALPWNPQKLIVHYICLCHKHLLMVLINNLHARHLFHCDIFW